MPPSHCLPRLISRSTAVFASCRTRPRRVVGSTHFAYFSTSAAKLRKPGQAKPGSTAPSPKKGGKSLRIKKRVPTRETGKRPAPGELKALRKRIILSNTNALRVPGLQDLKAEDVGDAAIEGTVVGIPMDPTVDQLRAVDAFKPNQAWGLFRRPAMLARREAVELGKLIRAVEVEKGETTVRKVFHGQRGSGKTTLLLQAMSMAFLRSWLVINFPDAMQLTIGHTAYAPLEGSNPRIYIQKNYTASLLGQIAKANEKLLETYKLAHEHTLPVSLKGDTLLQLVRLGAQDADIAWPVLQAFWRELTTPSNDEKAGGGLVRPPVMICMDNVSFIMNDTKYIDQDAKPIHAHDFALVRHFVNLLQGTTRLPNGGMVLAATSGSNSPKSHALDIAISAREAGCTGVPLSNPYKKIDERSLKALSNIDTLNVSGLAREEARALVEYYALSGMVRRTVDESLVGEQWTLSGGGIVGELERAMLQYKIQIG